MCVSIYMRCVYISDALSMPRANPGLPAGGRTAEPDFTRAVSTASILWTCLERAEKRRRRRRRRRSQRHAERRRRR